jgi:hypothetical protein
MEDQISADNPAFHRQSTLDQRQGFETTYGVNPAENRQSAIRMRDIDSTHPQESPVIGALGGAGVGAGAATLKTGYGLIKNGADVVSNVKDAAKSVANAPGEVLNWLKTQTSNPYAGGRTQGEAYQKSELAAGKPFKSRGSNIPMRRGNLGIGNQIAQEAELAESAPAMGTLEKLGAAFTPTIGKAAGLAGKYFLGPVASATSAGEQTMEGLNRYNQGDTAGGIISSIGTGGDVASLLGAPEFGVPISLGARGVNYVREHPQEVLNSFSQASQMPMKDGGSVDSDLAKIKARLKAIHHQVKKLKK